MKVSQSAFDLAQASEKENWVKDAANTQRILYELVEHSAPAEPLRRLSPGRRFERALDVGVGCFGLGFLAVHLSDLIESIDGIDPLPRLEFRLRDAALQEYVDTIRSRVNYIEAMAESMPAPQQFYDMVSCINVVDHAKDPRQIVREIARVLRPGGLLAFGVSTLSLAGEKKWQLRRWFKPNDWHYLAHPHTYQWNAADDLVRTVPGEVLWSTSVRLGQRLLGRGLMSFWIIKKH